MNKDLLAIVKNKKIFDENETVVLALSGGIDSMVLFDVLTSVELNLNVIIAHVNHNKRSESINEYVEIEQLSKERNIIFEGLVLEKDIHGNFHEESRKKRFEFFYNVAKKHNSTKIVLAHHSDDQLETVLMRIVRGSSFGGYAGIKQIRPYKDIFLVRPLLDVSKDDITEYATLNNISYYYDQSNSDTVYTRNRFRNTIIPLIKEENPNIQKQINQFTSYINMADEYLNIKRDEFLYKFYTNESLDLPQFNDLEQILKIKVLKFIINSKTNDTVEVSYQQYIDMIELSSNETPNANYKLSKDFNLVKAYAKLYVEKVAEKQSISIEINDIGEYIINNELKYVVSHDKLGINHTQHIEVCYNDKVFPLYLRNRVDGDKMRLHVGTKKVKDILIDQKIPATQRETLILLATHDKVLWIPSVKKSFQDKSCIKKIYIYEVKTC